MRFSQADVRTRPSLRSQMVLGGLLILLVPMTIVGTVTFIKSAHTLEEISRLQLVQVAQSLSGMIQISLERSLKNLTTVASDPQVVRDAMSGDYDITQQKLRGLYPLLSADFEGIAVYDTSGTLRADGVDVARVGVSIAERNYFQSAKAGKTGVGPMVPSKVTGAPIFGLSAPILSPDGKFLGGVLGIVKAEYLTKYISSIKLGETGYVFMIDQEGTVVAHPNQDLILAENILSVAGQENLAKKMIQQRTEAVEYVYGGNKKVAGICPVALTGWSIGATQYKEEIMHLAYANMNFLLVVSALFIILIILAVLFFSKTISVPVQTTLATLNHAIDQAAEAIVIIGLDGNIQFANPAMASIVDRPVEQIVGKPFQTEIDAQNSTHEIQETMASGGVWSGRLSGTRQDGSPYTLNFTLTPVLSPVGKLMYYLAVGRDITRELLMQEQLQQSQKMEAIGTLAGGIAHDFNNILSAIFGYTELALDALEDRPTVESSLTEIFTAAKRARDLVGHILTFSRKANLGREPMIPKYVIQDTLKLLRASLPATIEIRDALTSSAAILGNATQIHQMVMNLCTNAGYEMKDTGGILDVSLDEAIVESGMLLQYPGLKPGNHLRIRVTDSGRGIPESVLERIFDPFFTTKPTGEGTGLGLSVVHGIAKSLEGEVLVTSEVGKGTTFTILLPIFESRLLIPGDEQQKTLPHGTERILLVDDETAVTRPMKALMEGLGYRVHAMNQSTAAWETFSAHPDDYDVVVTDYTMPQMTGIALSEKIRGLHSEIPIIICSGYLALRETLAELTPIEFVKKPVTAPELAQALRRILDRHEIRP